MEQDSEILSCPNCEHQLEAKDLFCSQCGQSTKQTRHSFGEFLHEILSGFFSMDSKIVHSLLPLISRPGFLSLEYLRGKKVKYLPPMRMYLTMSILYFFIIALQNKIQHIADRNTENTTALTTAINAESDSLKTTPTFSFSEETGEPETAFENYINHGLEKIEKDPEDFLKFLKDKLALIILLALPFFALALKILYFRHDKTYIEHLIFIFHTQSSLFLFLIFGKILGVIIPYIEWLAMAAYLVYAWFAVKNFYQQTGKKTSFMFLLINISFFLILFCTVLVALFVLFLIY